MTDMREHIAILVPEGSLLGDATETRSCTLELPVDASDELKHTEVVDHIRQSREIDSWGFRKYWKVSHIARVVEDPVEQIRELLRGGTYSPAHSRDGSVPYTLYTKGPSSGQCELTTLVISEGLRARVREWESNLVEEYDGKLPCPELCDAFVRVTESVREDFATEFIENPRQAQETLLVTAMDNERSVVDAVED